MNECDLADFVSAVKMRNLDSSTWSLAILGKSFLTVFN